jgi:hypothetical protein
METIFKETCSVKSRIPVRAHTIEFREEKRALNIHRNDLPQQSSTPKKIINVTSFDLKNKNTITDKEKFKMI